MQKALELTSHAQARLQQRAATYEDIRIVLELGELVRDVGGQCIEIALAIHQLGDLLSAGVPRERAQKLQQLRLVLSPDGRLVTLYKNIQFRRRSKNRRYSARQRAMRAALHERGHRRSR